MSGMLLCFAAALVKVVCIPSVLLWTHVKRSILGGDTSPSSFFALVLCAMCLVWGQGSGEEWVVVVVKASLMGHWRVVKIMVSPWTECEYVSCGCVGGATGVCVFCVHRVML